MFGKERMNVVFSPGTTPRTWKYINEIRYWKSRWKRNVILCLKASDIIKSLFTLITGGH